MSDLVLIAREAVVLFIVALVAAHTNAQKTKSGHYSTAVSIRSEARMTRGWSTPTRWLEHQRLRFFVLF